MITITSFATRPLRNNLDKRWHILDFVDVITHKLNSIFGRELK